MTDNIQRYTRQSIRLREYDYTQPGAYFVTLCVHNRIYLLGNVIAGEMRLNEYGYAVSQCWEWLTGQYTYVGLDEWVVMPNHMHGIIVITGESRGGPRTAPTATKRKPLGRLIGAFKTISSKRINEIRGTPGLPVWQRNYYEHIIRNDDDLHEIRRYIADNPARWAEDEYNSV